MGPQDRRHPLMGDFPGLPIDPVSFGIIISRMRSWMSRATRAQFIDLEQTFRAVFTSKFKDDKGGIIDAPTYGELIGQRSRLNQQVARLHAQLARLTTLADHHAVGYTLKVVGVLPSGLLIPMAIATREMTGEREVTVRVPLQMGVVPASPAPPVMPTFTPGTRVCQHHLRAPYEVGRHIKWTGTVIVRPEGMSAQGPGGQRLIWVHHDDTHEIKGHYDYNLHPAPVVWLGPADGSGRV